ncbi:glutamate-gated chloride channel-like [Neocloeon triangulifer]|uniref:glutamate-gated chloride channel-like n=1 Tax=Neocloeon triangulifer TaxID=2078957 RepID=UPI00286EBBC7|nr:glutamate-gated chloride channel-like [Neocloeon triangulifer]
MRIYAALLLLGCAFAAASGANANVEKIMNQLFPDVKTNLALRPAGNATDVSINMHILDFHSIDDEDQEFSVSMYIRQRWTDPRLKFESSSEVRQVVLNEREKIWVPDTFFVNERKTKFSDALTENSFLRIDSDGKVLYSTRLHTTLSCPMNHAKFPFDKQTCSFVLESYGYTKKDVNLVWFEGDGDFPVSISKVLTLKPFRLEGVGIDTCCKGSKCEFKDYSCLKVQFLVARTGFGRYLMQVYLPQALSITLAYLCLWLRLEWTKKIFLSGVSILGTSILAAFASSLGPETNDCTALDAWGFWNVILSALPLAVLIVSRLINPKVDDDIDDKLELKERVEGTKIERIAIYMIPLIFVLYNFVYWANYANRIDFENGISTERKVPY